ncbi:TetR/AcrR family transcriptional regulator [Spongisporangium articulatum]|uniref:TetR/AcrR family transcriptional regulator n=1 Tax=Spongisporangium articulatum TaxID=3362603 RepID=A0ABW8AQP1_9ACTN
MARTAAPNARERVLLAAGGLFYAHGIRAVGMQQIIDAAGCGKNLVYGHFPSKNDLVAGYLEAVATSRVRSAGRAVRQAGDDPREQLVAMVAQIAADVRGEAQRGCAVRNYLVEFPDADAETDPAARVARHFITTTHAEVDKLAERVVVQHESAGPARDLADAVMLLIDGLYGSAGRPDAVRAGAAAVSMSRKLVGLADE